MGDSPRFPEHAGPDAEVRFRARVADALGEAVIAARPTGEITFWNAAAERLLGISAAEVLGRSLSQVSPGAAALLDRGQPWAGELSLRRGDGTTLRAAVAATPLCGDRGELQAVVCLCRDGSESHTAAEAIRENALLQAQLDASLEGMLVVVSGKVVAVSRRVREVWGGVADGLVGRSSGELWALASGLFGDPDSVRSRLAAMRAGEVSALEVTLKSGRVLRMRMAPIQGPSGPIGNVTFLRDVTVEHTAQRSLEARARHHEAVANLGHRALLGIELQALFGEAMAVIARTLEVEYASFVGPAEGGRPALRASFGGPRDLEAAQDGCGCGARSRLSVPVTVCGVPHGAIAAYSTARRAFTADELHFLEAVGNVLGAAIERRELQAHLMVADRLASVGTLAAGLAHELNNPLAYVTANLGYLADELGRAGARGQLPLAELLLAAREAREGTERMRGIISELRGFSRVDEDRRAEVDVRGAVESAVALAWNAVKRRARLVKELQEVPPVLADEGRLGQVFLNLLVNAEQAIPEGNPEQNEIRIRTCAAPGGMVAVEVADTGCGIPPEDLDRIFDPFFTTKPVGVGTGLGLSVCHGIVTGLGGSIEVRSRVGEGSAFRVLLPAARAQVARGRVLVVDDEPLILAVFRRVLGAAHDVDTAGGAAEAVERLARGRYDIVFCDLTMPEKSGMELYRELSRDAPEVASRMIFMTGGAFGGGARQFLDEVPNPRIEKPFDAAALRALVASRLSAKATCSPCRP